MSRLLTLAILVGFGSLGVPLPGRATAAEAVQTQANVVVELSFVSSRKVAEPSAKVELTAVFTDPDGQATGVPGFWAGGQTWRVRFATRRPGVYKYRTECSDTKDDGLHGREGSVDVVPYSGDNRLYRHGPIRVAANRRYFEHADGTPFLWLGDTWWMGLCERLHWPDEFQRLAADRKEKGFNVIQIVAGLYPDMPAFDDRGRNEAGFPWEKDYARINPAYFDAADRRIAHLVDAGFVPCIVGAWGYHLPWLGEERLRQHWRYLVARYGAYPVVWCIAGEGTMPYYLSNNKKEESERQRRGLTDIAADVRKRDPFHRPITIHPPSTARECVTDVSVLDFDMLQTGHGDRSSIPNTIRLIRQSRSAKPGMPTVVGEVCYEGILGTCFDDVQRFMVWSSLLSGTAGHTYGANGIWQVNRSERPFGASPHGGNWGNTPWDEAMRLPGSRQTGLARRLLEEHPWQQFEVHPEWAAFAPDVRRSPRWGRWIWFPEGDPAVDAPVAKRYFRKTFTLPDPPGVWDAVLRVAIDDRCTIYLNGRRLGAHAGFPTAREFLGLERWLRPGRNVIAIEAENAKAPVAKNPAGLLCSLQFAIAEVGATAVNSDTSWKCSKDAPDTWQSASFNDSEWEAAHDVAHYGSKPWGTVRLELDEMIVPYVAGVPGQVRIIYLPLVREVVVKGIEPGAGYQASYFDPISGKRTRLGSVRPNDVGAWSPPAPPYVGQDWILILEK